MFAVIGGSAVVPVFARKLRIPSAALEILYGIFLFNWIVDNRPEWFSLMKEFGLIYLMFLVGMELDLRKFVKERNFIWYIIIPLLPLVITPFIFHWMGYSFYLGIAVSMISAGIIIPVLKESETIDTPWGRDIIGIALTGELLSIMVLMGVDIHDRYGFTLRAGTESAKLILLFALAAIFLRLLYIIAWWNPEEVEKIMESEDPVEEGIRAVILIAFTGALIAYSSGLEPILGSFIAGLVFSYVFKNKARFEDKINAVGFGFFTPFFFIGIGADLDMDIIRSVETLSLSIFLTLMVFASNIFPLIFFRFMKLQAIEGLGMSFIFSAPLSMMVVAGTLGIRMDIITESARDSLVLAGVVSSIVFPSFFRMIVKAQKSREPAEA